MKSLKLSRRAECPVVGLGTFKAEPGIAYRTVKDAIRIGYRHIDCAPVYGNQKEVGAAIRESIEAGIVSREQLWVTSKLWNDCHAPQDVEPALTRTLAELGLEYLDLYLVHWPVAVRKGLFLPESAADLVPLTDMPLTATWSAMERTVDSGLVRQVGVSNFSAAKLDLLLAGARIRPVVNQIECHPYLQQRRLIDFCQRNRIDVTAYSPLGSPDRPDRLKQDGEPTLMREPTVLRLAEQYRASPAQVLLGWAIDKGIIVIPKSSSPERLKENLEAADMHLKPEDLERIDRLDRHRRYYTGSAWTLPGSGYTMETLWDE